MLGSRPYHDLKDSRFALLFGFELLLSTSFSSIVSVGPRRPASRRSRNSLLHSTILPLLRCGKNRFSGDLPNWVVTWHLSPGNDSLPLRAVPNSLSFSLRKTMPPAYGRLIKSWEDAGRGSPSYKIESHKKLSRHTYDDSKTTVR